MPNKTAQTKQQGETIQNNVQKAFLGMMMDCPASEIPNGYSALNRNCVDYSTWKEGRTGSRVYAAMPVVEEMM
jgi:hypothetical protein